MVNVYFDTEFTGLHQETKLISIGMVSEDGKRFYGEVLPRPVAKKETDFNWLKENVEPYLQFEVPLLQIRGKVTYSAGTESEIASAIKSWLFEYGKVRMWSDCLAYDWVLFESLFCNEIPNNVHYIPLDLCTLLEVVGVDPDISREEFSEVSAGTKHHALWDAEIIRKCCLKCFYLLNNF